MPVPFAQADHGAYDIEPFEGPTRVLAVRNGGNHPRQIGEEKNLAWRNLRVRSEHHPQAFIGDGQVHRDAFEGSPKGRYDCRAIRAFDVAHTVDNELRRGHTGASQRVRILLLALDSGAQAFRSGPPSRSQ